MWYCFVDLDADETRTDGVHGSIEKHLWTDYAKEWLIWDSWAMRCRSSCINAFLLIKWE